MNTQANIEILEKPILKLTTIAKIQATINTLRLWHRRANSRLALSRLDQQLLDDIGVSRQQARDEMLKPFWKQ